MTDYTTCRRCKEILQVTEPGETVHPRCEPVLTRIERCNKAHTAAVAAGDKELMHELAVTLAELVMRPPDMLKEALHYAGWGWPVFPLNPGSKEPATPHGFLDATDDPERIRRWWKRYPDCNIGVPTGVLFDVIDVDAPKHQGQIPGALALIKLQEAGDLPDTHAKAATGNFGLHLYIEPQGKGCTTGLMPSIDYRGEGGYVVVSPSVLTGGRAWSWINPPSPVIRK